MRRRVEMRQSESAKNKQVGQAAQEKTIQVRENFLQVELSVRWSNESWGERVREQEMVVVFTRWQSDRNCWSCCYRRVLMCLCCGINERSLVRCNRLPSCSAAALRRCAGYEDEVGGWKLFRSGLRSVPAFTQASGWLPGGWLCSAVITIFGEHQYHHLHQNSVERNRLLLWSGNLMNHHRWLKREERLTRGWLKLLAVLLRQCALMGAHNQIRWDQIRWGNHREWHWPWQKT